MIKIESVQKDITKNTKKKYKKNEWKDIGRKNLIRNCPSCKKELKYSGKHSYYKANLYKSLCRSCGAKIANRKQWGEKRSLSIPCFKCGKIRNYTTRVSARGAERRKSMCMICSKTNPTVLSNKRKAALKRFKNLEINEKCKVLSYNPKASNIFQEIENICKLDGYFAGKNGERVVKRYMLDYYEPNLNIVIEYDEPYHQKSKQKMKDKIRQKRIIKELNCQFYRIKDGQNWKDVLPKHLYKDS